MNNDLISVIIPVYNTEKYLEDCLNSIINQTYKNLEIIIINDGSNDKSLKICEKYKNQDNRIILISQQNSGQATARNKGLEIAKGNYIGFIDSDDWIDSNYYEELLKACKKNNADFSATNIYRKYKNFQKIRMFYDKEEVITNLEDKYKINNIPKCCYLLNKLFKAAKLKEFNLKFNDGKYFEDISFTIRVAFYLNSCVTVPRTNYWYRANQNSTVKSVKNINKKINDRYFAYRDMIDFAEKHKINALKKYGCVKKEIYLGKIKFIKIKEYRIFTIFLLFGLIPIFIYKNNIKYGK